MSIDTTEPIGQVFYAADGGDDETGAGYYMKPCVHWFGKAPAADTKLYTTPQPAQATQAEVTDDGLISKDRFYGDDHVQDIAHALAQECEQAELDPNDLVTVNRAKLVAIAARVLEKARAILALRPERVPMTPREIELIDGMIAVQLDHAQRCDAISNRAMSEKQKGWDMERVELLRRIRSFGITAQAKKEGE